MTRHRFLLQLAASKGIRINNRKTKWFQTPLVDNTLRIIEGPRGHHLHIADDEELFQKVAGRIITCDYKDMLWCLHGHLLHRRGAE